VLTAASCVDSTSSSGWKAPRSASSSAWVTGMTVPCRGLLGSWAEGTDVHVPEARSWVSKAT
jgi:hypothetical protein